MAGAATTAEALTFALRGLSVANIATAAVVALAGGFYLLSKRLDEAGTATEEYSGLEQKAATVRNKAEEAARKLAAATGAAAKAARENAAATRAEAEALLKTARAALFVAETKQMLAEREQYNQTKALKSVEASGAMTSEQASANRMIGSLANIIGVGPDAALRQSRANLEAAKKALTEAEAAVAASDTPSGGGGAGSAGDSGKKTKTKAARDTAYFAEQDLARLKAEELQAQMELATSADDRAKLAEEMLALDKAQRIAEIKANKDLTAAQRKAALATIERLYGPEAPDSGDITVSKSLYQRQIDRDRAAQLEREAQDLAEQRYRSEQDVLRNQYDLADSQSERKRLAIAMIDLEERYQRALLEAIIASESATAAVKEKARIALAALGEISAGQREVASRQNESPLEAYRRRIDRSPDQINEQIESYVVDELQHVQDSIASGLQKAIGTKDPLISGLINLFIQEVIMKPIANALAQASSSGGGLAGFLGGIGSILGIGQGTPTFGGGSMGNPSGVLSIFGGARASGGPVSAGKTYLVGEKGPELWKAPWSGKIVPNHELMGGAARRMVGAVAANPGRVLQTVVVKVEANDYFDARVDERASRVAAPIASRQSSRAAGASYAAGQQSTPSTIHKYNQLKG